MEQICLPFVDCKIEDVTVFNDRAEIVRVVKVNMTEAGLYRIELQNLPKSILDSDNIRVKGSGSFVLLDVGTKDTIVDNAPELEALQKEIESLEAIKASLSGKVQVAEDEIKLLMDMTSYQCRPASHGAALAPPDVDTAMRLLDTFVQRKQSIQSRIQELNATLSQHESKLGELDTKRRMLLLVERRSSAVINIRATQAGEAVLKVHTSLFLYL